MIEVSGVWIFSISIFLIVFFSIVLIAKFLTKPIDSMNFSFLRIFPFEVLNNSEKGSFIYRTLLFLFVPLCLSPIFLLINSKGLLENFNNLSILISSIYGLASICFVFINIFDVTHVKAHLILFEIFACLVLLANALTCTKGLVEYKAFLDHSQTMPILLIGGVFAGVFSILSLLVILNPRLASWARLEQIEGKENEYARPKKFPLAYSEWALFFLLFLGECSFFVELIVK